MSRSESKLAVISPAEQKFRSLAAERILVLDGAMGTMIQELKLRQEDGALPLPGGERVGERGLRR
jgi:hypothetical protein